MGWLFGFVRKAAQWLWSHFAEATLQGLDEFVGSTIEVVVDIANGLVQRAATWARRNLTSIVPEGPVVRGLKPMQSEAAS